ncbi:MAG: [Fe-Fe] hydrogenase large subunit C-terminal domain-containing protein [Candidatus Latescibacteria bacterium]|nr:[Fe-Fe] hydrogenase large subunit C-terminal domain-containing protein [Candidatus Latescibacterota bacterium]
MDIGQQLVATIPERCRLCYTCVRDCPAKAIRITGGQAEVVAERCIGCGNCVKVCRRNAKQVAGSIDDVRRLLAGPRPVAAAVAPSFPAEFLELTHGRVVGALRALGFDLVCEVAFGADLVARRYAELISRHPGRRYIATTCPAIVSYVEKFEPELVPNLAPVVSPMVATARALRRRHGDDLAVVFIGPCIAKKVEAVREGIAGDVEAALTFTELRRYLAEAGIEPSQCEPSDFDGPAPGLGALFPISRGLLQAAGLTEDLLSNEVVAGTGPDTFMEAIDEFRDGVLDVQLLELLSCKGCIMGAGMTTTAPLFRRRTAVSSYVRERLWVPSGERRRAELEEFAHLDLMAVYAPHDTRMSQPSPRELVAIMERLGKFAPEDELDCGACGYRTCREHAVAIHTGMAENEMCLPHTIERLKESLDEINVSHRELASTQQALINAEKLASMGQLSAGIAHEVNNPLGVVLLYANMLLDEAPPGSPLREDLQMIVEQADRCKKVVGGLLNFARKSKVVRRRIHVPELVDRALKAVIAPPGVEVSVELRLDDPYAELDGDQIIQVLTNLAVNAVEAMPNGGRLRVVTEGDAERITLRVVDTGTGIPRDIVKKIFEPLFTTKQIGKGTGLGLAVSYGIVKMHQGQVQVFSNADPREGPTGTTFVVTLPRAAKGEPA